MSRRFTVIGLIAITLIAAGCSAKNIRQITYPPDFTYIDKNQLSTVMWELAYGIANVNQALGGTSPLDTSKQVDVVTQIKNMEATARSIASKARNTNHPIIEDNIDSFLLELERARRAAEMNPPNYFLAGRLTGSCMNCHRFKP